MGRIVGIVCPLDAGVMLIFFFQAEDGIRDLIVTGVQTCALPISSELQSRSDLVCRLLLVTGVQTRSEEHTSELQSRSDLVCRLLLENKKQNKEHNLRLPSHMST